MYGANTAPVILQVGPRISWATGWRSLVQHYEADSMNPVVLLHGQNCLGIMWPGHQICSRFAKSQMKNADPV